MIPIVSISCLAYNHEKYIKDAIEGFLMQKTTFSFEIIIHDDASTDNTADIIREYATRYPNLIFPIFQSENQFSKGINPGFEFVVPKCKGKYIAACEGDDYWTDPYKLQNQIDFLEENPEYGMVSSDINLIDENGNSIPDNNMVLRQREKYKQTVSFFDLLETNLINSLTVCAKAELLKQLANRVVNEHLWFVFDYWFWLNISLTHKIRISHEKTASYRIHNGGISRANNFIKIRKPLVLFDTISIYLKRNVFIKKEEASVISGSLYYILRSSNVPFSKKINTIKVVFLNPILIFFIAKLALTKAKRCF